jgi:hypothetical protein
MTWCAAATSLASRYQTPLTRPAKSCGAYGLSGDSFVSPWILLLVLILALLAWWLLPAALGAAVHAPMSGRFYLRTLLKQAGVLQLVPDGAHAS